MKSIVDYLNQELKGSNIFCEVQHEGFSVHLKGEEASMPVIFMKINPDLHLANREALRIKKDFPYARVGVLLDRNITREIIKNGDNFDFFEVASIEDKARIAGLIRNEVDVLLAQLDL